MTDSPAPDGLLVALDTNVLVRLFVDDDPDQHQRVHQLAGSLTRERPGLVHPVVLCEFVWALRRVYRVPKAEVAGALGHVLRTSTLSVVRRRYAERALELYRSGPFDFADCLIAAEYADLGAEMRTFDQKAQRLPGVSAL
jgi:predicted nucleic-acid-binding protein